MLLLSQCMDLKAMMADVSAELKIVMWLVLTALALSVLKVFYYHRNSSQNVRKIKQLMETNRSHWRSGDLTSSGPVSPLPKIERVPVCLSLRRRSGHEHHQSADHNSSNESIPKMKPLRRNSSSDSIQKMRLVKPDSPPSRSCVRTSTNERTETEPRRRKNQIQAAEMLM
jgi:hypothetical protein